jgi:hypothetical protein
VKRVLALSLIGLLSTAAQAATTNYSNRAAFEAAISGATTETFDSYSVDTSFAGTPVNIGDFSVVTTGTSTSTSGYNYIDVVPLATSESDVNGTNDLRIYTNSSSSFTIQFNTAITSLGFDWANLNDSSHRTDLYIDGVLTNVLDTTFSYPETGFVGFISDIAFTTIEFRGLQNDVFGLDNITYASHPVPVPAAVWLFGSGLFGLVGFSKKRKSTTN